MLLKSKEHHDFMVWFEKNFSNERLDKEARSEWPKGHFYQSGEVNKLFLACKLGHSLAKSVYQ